MRRWTMLVGLGLGVATSAAHAATYTVLPNGTGDFPTIQAAIDASNDEDVVELGDGVFQGDGNRDLRFRGKKITVRSSSGVPSTCVIDAQGTEGDPYRGFWFVSEDSVGAMLDGVTVVNGFAPGPSLSGGGVYCSIQSRVTISNCILRNNMAYLGGGIAVLGDSVRVTNCVIEQNQAVDDVQSVGGGVFCEQAVYADFIDCTIRGNVGDAGGGVTLEACRTVRFERCSIYGNEAGGGGGLLVVDCELDLVDCTIAGNRAGAGGGIYMANFAWVRAERTILWGNRADVDSRTNEFVLFGDPVTIELSCCATDPDGYLNTNPGAGGNVVSFTNGTVFTHPLYCGAEPATSAPTTLGDYSLGSNSPCLAVNSPCGERIGALDEGCGVVGVEPEFTHPEARLAIHPNPFRSRATISASGSGPGAIRIFDATGRLVRAFPTTGYATPIVWDGRDAFGRDVAAGVYFVRRGHDERRLVRID